jgi:hypothetical protein
MNDVARLPSGRRTGELRGLQYLTSNPPPSDSGRRMSYFCTAMVSGTRSRRTRPSETPRFPTPVASGSAGLSGKTSKIPLPKISSRLVIVARRYSSVAATMVKSGSSTRYKSEADSNRDLKSGAGGTPSRRRTSWAAPADVTRGSVRVDSDELLTRISHRPEPGQLEALLQSTDYHPLSWRADFRRSLARNARSRPSGFRL